MPAKVLIGLQWGDEGKGKITDYLSEKSDLIVRYQGGNNAGHTVVTGNEKFKLHLIPSGILHPDKKCILGNGMVINLDALVDEMNGLMARGISFENLFISPRAHVILPFHILRDLADEAMREDGKIGTTGRGIGPAYRDKVDRCGLRIGDLEFPETAENIIRTALKKNPVKEVLPEKITADLFEKYQQIKKYVVPVNLIIHQALSQGKNILLEGAQGTMLDLDHGTYPYVTSSHPTAGGACTGSGIGPSCISSVTGVVKAYTTRVGEGPFPTELKDDLGEMIRRKGAEYGTTTGRPRRTGWLDLPALKYACRINGVTEIVITKLDILTGIPLKVAVAYTYRGTVMEDYPENEHYLEECIPVYEEFAAFNSPDVEKDMNSKRYLDFVEKNLGIPICLVSTGEDRSQTYHRREKKAGVAQG